MTREYRVGSTWVTIGAGRFFGIGLYLDSYHFNIDLICVYLSIEF